MRLDRCSLCHDFVNPPPWFLKSVDPKKSDKGVWVIVALLEGQQAVVTTMSTKDVRDINLRREEMQLLRGVDYPVEVLRELLPQMPDFRIREALRDANYDVDAAGAQLLSEGVGRRREAAGRREDASGIKRKRPTAPAPPPPPPSVAYEGFRTSPMRQNRFAGSPNAGPGCDLCNRPLPPKKPRRFEALEPSLFGPDSSDEAADGEPLACENCGLAVSNRRSPHTLPILRSLLVHVREAKKARLPEKEVFEAVRTQVEFLKVLGRVIRLFRLNGRKQWAITLCGTAFQVMQQGEIKIGGTVFNLRALADPFTLCLLRKQPATATSNAVYATILCQCKSCPPPEHLAAEVLEHEITKPIALSSVDDALVFLGCCAAVVHGLEITDDALLAWVAKTVDEYT
ncbi:hypothetical protein DIPPA_23160 [Diplonema papillatum]|nr:hypothetical protein DIPPA_23160 [Diplonema papillatum]